MYLNCSKKSTTKPSATALFVKKRIYENGLVSDSVKFEGKTASLACLSGKVSGIIAMHGKIIKSEIPQIR